MWLRHWPGDLRDPVEGRVCSDGLFVDACDGILVSLRLVLGSSSGGGGARLVDNLGITPDGPPIITGFWFLLRALGSHLR